MSWFINLITLIINYLCKSAPEEHFITFEGHTRGNPPPKVGCTCGWSYGPNHLIHMLNEAKDHERATGHRLVDSEYCG